MPSNLKQTTRECMYVVRRGNLWSRDKDGGHTMQSDIAKNIMLHANFMAVSSTEPELLPIEVLNCGNMDFRSDLIL